MFFLHKTVLSYICLKLRGIYMSTAILICVNNVPDVMITYIRGWMQMVYCHMIYSPETEQIRQWDTWIQFYGILVIFTYKMVTIHRIYVLCAWWVLFVVLVLVLVNNVPDVMITYIREWMQMVYCHMIYSPETEQIRQWDTWIRCYGILVIFTYKMVTIHRIYVLCAWWVLFVMPDSSSRLPFRSISLLPPPLLVINSLSCSPLGGAGPSPCPPPGLTPFPSGSRHKYA